MAGENDERLPYPYKLLPLDPARNKRIADTLTGYPNGFISANQWGFKLSATATEADLEDAYNYPLDPRDVWLVSPPKCGNTWSQEIIWLLANNLDYEGAKSVLMPDRWNFMDWDLINDKQWASEFMGKLFTARPEMMKVMKSMAGDPHRPSPKFVKSHLPISMNNPRLLDTCKTFFVGRNPKDACLSFYKHCRLFRNQGFVGDLPTFAQMYMDGEALESPTIPVMVEAWNLRHHPNLYVVFYEELLADLPGQLTKMAAFLGKQYTPEQIAKLVDHLHIDNFRKNPWVNMEGEMPRAMMNDGEGSFIRCGKVGDWGNHCTPELDAKFEAWMDEQLKGTDLRFITKL